MSRSTIFVWGLALALLTTTPTHAWQSQAGGAGQQAGAGPGQRGAMMHDRMPMRDRTHMQDRGMMRDRSRARLDDGSMMYGWQLMTPQERDAYRTRMRSLKTERERQALRTQHHAEMQQRAAERGVRLPSTPPGNGGG